MNPKSLQTLVNMLEKNSIVTYAQHTKGLLTCTSNYYIPLYNNVSCQNKHLNLNAVAIE